MKITKIKTYQTICQAGNHDRYLDPALLPTPLDIFEKQDFRFTWAFNSTTEAEIHVNSKKRFNYIAIKSDLFTDDSSQAYSYWFVDKTKNIDSAESLNYEIKLDVMLTFGKSFLDHLKGKEIRFKRRHVDRFIKHSDGSYEINIDHPGLVYTDFKVPDTHGQEFKFFTVKSHDFWLGKYGSDIISGKFIGNSEYNNIEERYKHHDNDTNKLKYYNDFVINNGIELKVKYDWNNNYTTTKWYKYAIITPPADNFKMLGRGKILNVNEGIFHVGGWYVEHKTIAGRFTGVGIDNLSYLVPISVDRQEDSSSTKSPNRLNTMGQILTLPQNYVKSIFLSPFPLHVLTLNKDYAGKPRNEQLFNKITQGDDLTFTEYNYNDLLPISNIKLGKTDHYPSMSFMDMIEHFSDLKIFFQPVDKTKTGIVAFNYNYKINSVHDPIKYELDGNVHDYYEHWQGPILKLKPDINIKGVLNSYAGEVGLWHPDIIGMELHIKTVPESIRLDSYNYVREPWLTIKYFPDITGLAVDVNISNYHYFKGSLKTNLNIFTDAGTNYVNNHRNSLEAQREGIRLQKKLNNKEKQRNLANDIGRIGADIVSFNALGAVSGIAGTIFHSQSHNIKNEIYNNELKKIDAAIQDAGAAAPSMIQGSGSDIVYDTGPRFDNFLTKIVRIPNKSILHNIARHYNKFGYSYPEYDTPHKDEWYKTRHKFDYLQIENGKDYYDGFLNVDESIITLIENELKSGVRLWWQSKVEYNDNFERSLVPIP